MQSLPKSMTNQTTFTEWLLLLMITNFVVYLLSQEIIFLPQEKQLIIRNHYLRKGIKYNLNNYVAFTNQTKISDPDHIRPMLGKSILLIDIDNKIKQISAIFYNNRNFESLISDLKSIGLKFIDPVRAWKNNYQTVISENPELIKNLKINNKDQKDIETIEFIATQKFLKSVSAKYFIYIILAVIVTFILSFVLISIVSIASSKWAF